MGKEIGIDLGTTNTVVSYVNKHDKIATLKFKNNKYIIPSAIYFKSKSDIVIGEEAKKNGLMKKNKNAYVDNFKSNMGNPKYKYSVTAENGDKFKLTSKQLASKFLKKVLYSMQDKINREFSDTNDNYIDKAVITVPAKFNDVERQATKQAGISAGLQDVQLMAEPTAGAIAYMEDHGVSDRNILVYDFGGGTFDISLLENNNGVFKVRSTDGDKHLGGNNITQKIVNLFIDQLNEDFEYDIPYTIEDYDSDYCELQWNDFIVLYMDILSICNNIKEELSEGESVFEDVLEVKKDDDIQEWEYYYTAEEICKAIEDEVDTTINITKNMLKYAKDNDISIDNIILTGGSSQLPMVEEKLSKIFNANSIDLDVDVTTLISRGATLVANEKYSIDKIEETTNAEIGVKSRIGSVVDGFKPIIPDGVRLPYTASSDFIVQDKNAKRMTITIYERNIKSKPKNETIRDKSVQKLDELIIDNLPDSDSNLIVTITFTANKDGSLKLSADIKSNGKVISKEHTIEKESNLL